MNWRWLFRKRELIKAVRGEDLPRLLRSLGLHEKLEDGKLLCVSCGDTISLDNLSAITSRDGSLVVLCGRGKCSIRTHD